MPAIKKSKITTLLFVIYIVKLIFLSFFYFMCLIFWFFEIKYPFFVKAVNLCIVCHLYNCFTADL